MNPASNEEVAALRRFASLFTRNGDSWAGTEGAIAAAAETGSDIWHYWRAVIDAQNKVGGA